MGKDINTGYPTGYYQLKRRVAQDVMSYLDLLKDQPADHDRKDDVQRFIASKSLHSGLPETAIKKIFLQIDHRLEVLF